jgi:hypothetical protein
MPGPGLISGLKASPFKAPVFHRRMNGKLQLKMAA